MLEVLVPSLQKEIYLLRQVIALISSNPCNIEQELRGRGLYEVYLRAAKLADIKPAVLKMEGECYGDEED